MVAQRNYVKTNSYSSKLVGTEQWSPQMMSILIPETWDNVQVTWQKKKLRIQIELTLKWEDYHGLMDYVYWPNVIAKVLVKDRNRIRVRERLKDAAGFEDGRRAVSQGMTVVLKAGKGKKMDSPLQPLEGTE